MAKIGKRKIQKKRMDEWKAKDKTGLAKVKQKITNTAKTAHKIITSKESKAAAEKAVKVSKSIWGGLMEAGRNFNRNYEAMQKKK